MATRSLLEEGPTRAREVRIPFTWLCVGIALPLALALGVFGPYGSNRLPIVTALFITELGALVSVLGAVACLLRLRHGLGRGLVLSKMLLSLCLAGMFVWNGLGLWPTG